MRTVRMLAVGVLCSIFLLDGEPAFAYGIGVILPFDDAGEGFSESISGPGELQINPDRESFVTDKGLVTKSSVTVDNSGGIIRGYASASLDHSETFIVGTNATGAGATGVLMIDSSELVGEDTTPAELTFEMEFDGAFQTLSGTPTFDLFGDLVITTIDTSSGIPTGTIYQSLLEFSSSTGTGGNIETATSGVESPLLGGAETPFAGAIAEVLSMDADDLHGRLRLSIPIMPGIHLMFSAVVSGVVAPEPDLTDTDSEDGVTLLPSEGIVDFSHTATIRLVLPEGFSLASSDPLAAGIVETSPVPLPPSLFFLASALLTAAGARRRFCDR